MPERDQVTMIAGYIGFLVLSAALYHAFLADLIGKDLAIYLIGALSIPAALGARKLPELLRRSRKPSR
jgi:hypothetical protein